MLKSVSFFDQEFDQFFLGKILSEFAISSEFHLLELQAEVFWPRIGTWACNDVPGDGSLHFGLCGIMGLCGIERADKVGLRNFAVFGPGAIVDAGVGAALDSQGQIHDAGCDAAAAGVDRPDVVINFHLFENLKG